MLYKLGRHPYRSAHLHYILTADSYQTLTTHIFDPDDLYINSDVVSGVKESLLAKFELVEDKNRIVQSGFESSYYEVEHDFVLAPA
ncbi:MAG: protocatechuate 3,4-dioxygenase beta subunit [Granulosicoccus sp.]|jgi:protocatechuate 3,4-dioxygenase beta subunit